MLLFAKNMRHIQILTTIPGRMNAIFSQELRKRTGHLGQIEPLETIA